MFYTVKMKANELWWGGSNSDGNLMPFSCDSNLQRDFRKNAPNETMPFYVSNLGRIIWCEEPFAVEIKDGIFTFEANSEIKVLNGGATLREGFLFARKHLFPTDKRVLNRDFFKTVQYNTWIECLYHPTQSHVLKYAHDIIENGFEPGILMIDEGWHGRYGNWDFDKYAFPDPKAMVDELHKLGFKVLLWVVPAVCPDGEFFIEHLRKSNNEHANEPENYLFLRTKDAPERPALFHWWNGYSALLNMKSESNRLFLDNQLQHLMNTYGIDGFKFDGGNIDFYSQSITGEVLGDHTPAELNIAWNTFAAKYDYHEYKDTFKGASLNTIQRLSDRFHLWQNGLDTVIPQSLAQGIIGHPFVCPDMVGGGEWTCFTEGKEIDGELFVRWAQCSALFPMMQYSKAPWSCLKKQDCDLVLAAGKLHTKFTNELIEMVEKAEQSGEPIVRYMEYNYPNQSYAKITDQFMLWDKYLVAPVIEKGARKRRVVIPKGCWLADDGSTYQEGTYEIDCPINRLPYFKKISD